MPADSTAVCVLGMSRSGTSLTARVLDALGVFLGAEEELLQGELRQLAGQGESVLARAADANREGFWEHYRIMRLNERVLRALGGNWRDPPSLPVGWERSERLDPEREEARALLQESFQGQRLWGWKDPRNSLTLPFWQSLLPNMLHVICLRNPLDVAASLQRRDGMPIERGIDLWRTYVAAALANTAGRPRVLVAYESYFADPWATAARLADFIGRGDARDDPEIRRRVVEAVDEGLWRQRTGAASAGDDSHVPLDVAALHLLTQLLADDAAEDDGAEADLREAIDFYAEKLREPRAFR